MMMELQRQGLARRDRQPLHLKLLPYHEGFIGPPGAKHFLMHRCFGAVSGGQRLNHLFDVLNTIPSANHHRVGGFHKHEILDTDRCHQATLAANVVVAGTLQQHIPLGDIAIGISLTNLPER